MSKKKNILLVRSCLAAGGPGRKIFYEVQELLHRNYHVVIVTGGGAYTEEMKKIGVKCYIMNCFMPDQRTLWGSVKGIQFLRKIMMEESIDLIYGYNTASSMLAYWGRLHLKRKPEIVNVLLGNGKERMIRWMPLKHIVMSDEQKKQLITMGIPKDHLFVNYPSTIVLDQYQRDIHRRELLRQELNIGASDIVIGSVMTGMKGDPHIILEMERIIDSVQTNVYFVFVGNSLVFEQYREVLKHTKHPDRFLFLGWQKDIPYWMNGFDLFSHMLDEGKIETFGMVLTEAMAMEVPVIANNRDGMKDVVENGVTGFLVNSHKEYIEKMVLLIQDEAKRRDMGIKGRKRVEEFFTLEKSMDRLEEIFQSLTKEW